MSPPRLAQEAEFANVWKNMKIGKNKPLEDDEARLPDRTSAGFFARGASLMHSLRFSLSLSL